MAKCIVHSYNNRDEDSGNRKYDVYEDCKAGLGPECSLIVTEQVPDVTGKSGTGVTEAMVAMYAPGEWYFVEYE